MALALSCNDGSAATNGHPVKPEPFSSHPARHHRAAPADHRGDQHGRIDRVHPGGAGRVCGGVSGWPRRGGRGLWSVQERVVSDTCRLC